MEEGGLVIILIFQALAFSVLSAIVANGKNRSTFGWFFIGLLFGIFGFLAALVVGKDEPPQRVAAPAGNGQEESASSKRAKNERPHTSGKFDPEEHTKKCPDCAERIKLEALVCRYCGHRFDEDEVAAQLNEHQQAHQEQREAQANRWECRCGAVNSPDEELCPRCGRSPEAVI